MKKHIQRIVPLLMPLLLLLLTIGGMAIFVFGDFLLLNQLYLFTDIGSDTLNGYYPRMVHEARYGAEEGMPMRWSFYTGMGQNLYTNWQIIPDPIDLLTKLGVALAWGTTYLNEAYLAHQIIIRETLKIVLTGGLFYGYLRLLDLEKTTAFIGALCMAYCGYLVVGTAWYSNSATVVYGVFFLFAFELFFVKKIWWLLPIAIYFLDVLSPRFFFFMEFLVLYYTFRYFTTLSETEWDKKQFFHRFGQILLLIGLSMLLDAGVINSRLNNFLDSPRVAGSVSAMTQLAGEPVFHLESATHYLTIVMRLLGNDLLGNGSDFLGWNNYIEAPLFYCGLLTLLLLPQIFVQTTKRKRWIYGSYLGFWILLLIFPYLRHAFYGFAGDYYKTALSFFFPVTLLFYALKAFNGMVTGQHQLNTKVLFSTLVVLLILLFLPYQMGDLQIDSQLRLLTGIYLVIYALLLWGFSVVMVKPDAKRFVFPLIIILTVLTISELTFNSWQTVAKRKAISTSDFEARQGYNDYTKEAVAYLNRRDKGFYRVNKNYTSSPALHYGLNDAMVQGYYGTTSYSSYNQGYYIRFLQSLEVLSKTDEVETRWSVGLANHPLLQTFAGVKYQLIQPEKSEQATLQQYNKSGYRLIKKVENIQIFENEHFLPLGFTYDAYLPKTAFDQLKATQKTQMLFKAATLKEAALDKVNRTLEVFEIADLPKKYAIKNYQEDVEIRAKHSLNITYHGQNTIEGNIDLPKAELLFFSIPYDAGWHVLVNGQKQDLFLVNEGFMGTLLPAGKHDIKLYFNPRYAKVGRLVAVIVLIGYCLAVLWRLFNN